LESLKNVLGDTLIGLDHIGVAVPDITSGIAQWQQLGLSLSHQERNEEQHVDEAMLSIPSGVSIQLLAPTDADSTIAKFLERQGPGMQQIAFKVTDIHKAMELLTNAGIRLIYETAKSGTSGSSINFIHPKDMGGVLVELVQYANS
jgi:methylmalonyl-CoA/ethylmalonyl-CoA epimerase